MLFGNLVCLLKNLLNKKLTLACQANIKFYIVLRYLAYI